MRGIIFGKTIDSAYYRMKKLIKDYKRYWGIEPDKIRKSRNQFSVVFTNGDYWSAVRFAENQRARRANILIIDRELSMSEIDLAKYCLIDRPYSSINYYYYYEGEN